MEMFGSFDMLSLWRDRNQACSPATRSAAMGRMPGRADPHTPSGHRYDAVDARLRAATSIVPSRPSPSRCGPMMSRESAHTGV